ncbi:MAG TPA: hypothetical protein VEI97_14105, partial [bacterium]|nr:hypothetical protein [bacterium]
VETAAWFLVTAGSLLQALLAVKTPGRALVVPYFLLAWLPVTVLLLRPWGLSFWMHQLRTQMAALLLFQAAVMGWHWWNRVPQTGLVLGGALLLVQLACYDAWRLVVFNQPARRLTRRILAWFGLTPRYDQSYLPLPQGPIGTGAMGVGKASGKGGPGAKDRPLYEHRGELGTQLRSKERRAPDPRPPFSEHPPRK